MQYELKNLLRILREHGISGVFRKCGLYLSFPFVIRRYKRAGKKDEQTEAVDFAFDACSGLIRPLQVKSEILALTRELASRRPKIILEIGSAVGGNLFLFTQAAADNATVISIDLPDGKYGGGYPRWRIPLYRLFTSGKQKLRLIRADSHDAAARECVRTILNGREIDFLFIDGDHSYDGVKQDFMMYGPLVKNGGMIALHDIVPHEQEDGCGVDTFWREIKSDYPHKEFVEDREQRWAGIGLIIKNNRTEPTGRDGVCFIGEIASIPLQLDVLVPEVAHELQACGVFGFGTVEADARRRPSAFILRVLPQNADGSEPGPRNAEELDGYGLYRGWIDRQAGHGAVFLAGDTPLQALANCLRRIYMRLIPENDGFVLHAACIARGSDAYLFTGPSGAGKSTVCELSPQYLTVSDDLTAVTERDGCFHAWGLPSTAHHSAPSRVLGPYRVKDVFVLVQNTENKVVPLTGAEGVARALALPSDQLQPGIVAKALAILEELAHHVPFSELHFRKDPSFWECIPEGISRG